MTIYCIICVQRTYQKAFLNWLCQYFSFLSIFFYRFCSVEKCGVTPHCLSYRVSRINEETAFRFALFKHCIWIIVNDFILDHLVSKQVLDAAEKYPKPLQTCKRGKHCNSISRLKPVNFCCKYFHLKCLRECWLLLCLALPKNQATLFMINLTCVMLS